MRIAMVSEHASPLAVLGGEDAGGQNVHVAALAAALARRGHDVAVYTRRDGPDLPEQVEMLPGVQVVHVPAGPARVLPKDRLLPYMPEFGRWLAERWARGQIPDVVHSHFWMSGLAALEAAERVPVPVVHTFHALGTVKRRHQGDRDTSPAGRVEAETRVGTAADLVVATCSDEVAELGAMGIDRSRVRVVPCGVDVQLFSPDGEVHPPPGDQPFRLLSIGRLVERKGVETVVAALPLLPDVELLVAGGPDQAHIRTHPEARRLHALAEELGVEDRVRFVGSVSRTDVPALIRSADIVVAAPWYEPFGIVPLEAAACGRPLVGSAVGGLLDSVADGRTGALVPPRDPDALAAAITRLLVDPQLRARYGEAARARAEERFSWERVSAATEAAYAEVRVARTGTSRKAATA
ncbi:glycosyltransferase [Georgenia satyanarayanai]|uniref:glycosyltransferase n=1 Tax=Georgenia satyanarayanai TaxID=860221 RepID=UPI0012642D3C|nr:glycosyltransferase [Georgenia satyanarayanai]